jgi:hypothetical protein
MMLLGIALVALLARGPIVVNGNYVGIHFLALGCLFTLTGFNVINLGVMAKVIAIAQLPSADSRIRRWVLRKFTLEGGAVTGGALFLTGFAIDTYILLSWLRNAGSPQAETVHVAFAATLMIVLGLNIVFSSFLLSMFMADQQQRLDASSAARDAAVRRSGMTRDAVMNRF